MAGRDVYVFSDYYTERPALKSVDATPDRLEVTGGGGTGGSNVNDRVTRLETHFEYVRRDLDEIKADQKQANAILEEIRSRVTNLPSKNDLWNWKLQWLAFGGGLIALIVGGIIGGLALLLP